MRLDINMFRLIKPDNGVECTDSKKQYSQKKSTRELVLSIITRKGSVSANKIIQLTGMASSTVYRAAKSLESDNLIVRVKVDGISNNPNTFFSAA